MPTISRTFIQLSVSIYSASLHAFIKYLSSVYIDFACYYILIRFNICRMILKLVASHSCAELRGISMNQRRSHE